jgi:hypothetical protein
MSRWELGDSYIGPARLPAHVYTDFYIYSHRCHIEICFIVSIRWIKLLISKICMRQQRQTRWGVLESDSERYKFLFYVSIKWCQRNNSTNYTHGKNHIYSSSSTISVNILETFPPVQNAERLIFVVDILYVSDVKLRPGTGNELCIMSRDPSICWPATLWVNMNFLLNLPRHNTIVGLNVVNVRAVTHGPSARPYPSRLSSKFWKL